MIEFINEYIDVVTMLLCLCVGYIIKHIIPGTAINRFIPLIVGILGVIVSFVSASDLSARNIPVIILSGLVSGLASTGLYEALDNLIKRDGDKDGN